MNIKLFSGFPNFLKIKKITSLLVLLILLLSNAISAAESPKKLVYLVSDLRIPFWEIMSRGIKHQADQLGYELQFTAHAIRGADIKQQITFSYDEC